MLIVLISCKDNPKGMEKEQQDEKPEVQLEKTLTSEKNSEEKNGLILQNGKLGDLGPNASVEQLSADGILRKGKLKTGDGIIPVWFIVRAGDTLGYTTIRTGKNNINDITYTSPLIYTEDNLKVGSTFQDILKIYPNAKAYGSEIESRTYVKTDSYIFRLDASNIKYEIDNSEISPNAKIIEVIVPSTMNQDKTNPILSNFSSLKGGGSEPGWNIKAVSLAEGIYYSIILDYGEISLSGYGFYAEKDRKLKILQGKTEIPITINQEQCVDNAGNNNELTISFSFNDKIYEGCGNVDQNTVSLSPPKISKNVDHYICFNADKEDSNSLMVGYTSNGYAKTVKYEGQKESISLDFIAEEFQKGGAYPTEVKYYKEILNNQLNGWYKITHAGNWDYVEYQNVKTNTIFNFTIDHNKNPYSKKPCF